MVQQILSSTEYYDNIGRQLSKRGKNAHINLGWGLVLVCHKKVPIANTAPWQESLLISWTGGYNDMFAIYRHSQHFQWHDIKDKEKWI